MSVWRCGTDPVDFAYRQPEHRAATVRWYAVQLFARFAVREPTGDRSVLGWRQATGEEGTGGPR